MAKTIKVVDKDEPAVVPVMDEGRGKDLQELELTLTLMQKWGIRSLSDVEVKLAAARAELGL